MRLLITGSRTWDDPAYIARVLDELYRTSLGLLVIHGACPAGADAMADAWAVRRRAEGRSVLIERFPANWDRYGRAAGMVRNAEMVAAVGTGGSVACHAFIRDGSKGASHCVKLARRAGIPVTVHDWDKRGVTA